MNKIQFFCLAFFCFTTTAVAQSNSPIYDLSKPTSVTLTGPLSLAQKYGPPGYGENPAQDQKETICLLNLDTPISLKSKTSESHPDLQPAIQLVVGDKFDACEKLSGETVTVTGVLSEAKTGHHHTKAILTIKTLSRQRLETLHLQPGDVTFIVRYTLALDDDFGGERVAQIDVLDATGKTLHTSKPGYFLLQDSYALQPKPGSDDLLFTTTDDANFDGISDLGILSDRGITLWDCRDYAIFNPQTKALFFHKSWERLCNADFDSEQKQITTTERYGIGAVQEEIIKTYRLRGNKPSLLKTEHIKD